MEATRLRTDQILEFPRPQPIVLVKWVLVCHGLQTSNLLLLSQNLDGDCIKNGLHCFDGQSLDGSCGMACHRRRHERIVAMEGMSRVSIHSADGVECARERIACVDRPMRHQFPVDRSILSNARVPLQREGYRMLDGCRMEETGKIPFRARV